jgi:hypothetical protein
VIYCKSDPVVTVGTTILDLSIGIPLADQRYVTGPIEWKIQTPDGVDRDVVLSDPGLNLKGHTFEFTDGGKVAEDGTGTVRVKVSIPINKQELKAGEQIPTELTMIALNGDKVLAVGTAEGTTDMTKVELTFRAEW